MVSEKKLYHMREKAKDDKHQLRIGIDGKLKPSKMQMVTVVVSANYNQMVMCPFCLHAAKLQAFLVSTKKGISQSKAACPECKNGMMMKSLTTEWSPEEYADWVYNYRSMGFWQKVPFNLWKERLHKIGWSHRFWTRYKELKGSDESEDYWDYLDSQQQEAKEQWEREQY